MSNLKDNIKKLAKKANMSSSDLEKLYEKTYKEYEKKGVEEDKLEETTFRRIQAFLSKRFAKIGGSGIDVEGFILGAQRPTNWAFINRRKVQNMVDKLKDPKDAVSQGLMDEDGNLLYVNDKFREGERIPEEDWSREAYGVITKKDKEGREEQKFAIITLRGMAAKEVTPLFRPLRLNIKVNDNTNANIIKVSTNIVPEVTSDEYVDLTKFVELIEKAYDDRIISVKQVDTFAQKYQDDRNAWAILEGDVSKFGYSQKGNPGVSITDTGLEVDDDIDEVDVRTIYFPKDTEFDFDEKGVAILFIVSTMIGDNGDSVLMGLGHWTPPAMRVDKSNIKEVDVKKPWG
jgi:hypothetical protein